MTETNQGNIIINSVDTQTEKKKRGRPKAEWRHNEDGTYNTQPLDPKYQLKYWHEQFRKPYAMCVGKSYNVVAVEFTNINAQCIANWPNSRRNRQCN